MSGGASAGLPLTLQRVKNLVKKKDKRWHACTEAKQFTLILHVFSLPLFLSSSSANILTEAYETLNNRLQNP